MSERLVPLVGGPLDGAKFSTLDKPLENWERLMSAGGWTLYHLRFENGRRVYRYDWLATKLARAHAAAEGAR